MKRKKVEDEISKKGTKGKKPTPFQQKLQTKKKVVDPVVNKKKVVETAKAIKKGRVKPKTKKNKPNRRPPEKAIAPIKNEQVEDLIGENKVERAYSGGAHELYLQKRRSRVTELYLEGRSQRDIALALGVSVTLVSQDLKAVRDEWLAMRVKDMDAVKAEELARIDHLEAVAWTAWRSSCLDEKVSRNRVRYAEQETKNPKGGRRKAGRNYNIENELPGDDEAETRTVEKTIDTMLRNRSGDPKFLEQIAWCIQTRLKITGLLNQNKDGQGGHTVVINLGSMVADQKNPSLPVVTEAKVLDHRPEQKPDFEFDDPIEARLRQVEAQGGIMRKEDYDAGKGGMPEHDYEPI